MRKIDMVIWDASEAETASSKPFAEIALFFSIPNTVRRLRAEGADGATDTSAPIQAPTQRRLDLRRPINFRPAWT